MSQRTKLAESTSKQPISKGDLLMSHELLQSLKDDAAREEVKKIMESTGLNVELAVAAYHGGEESTRLITKNFKVMQAKQKGDISEENKRIVHLSKRYHEAMKQKNIRLAISVKTTLFEKYGRLPLPPENDERIDKLQ